LYIKNKIDRLSKEIEEKVIKIRRELHQYPELAFKEKKTASIIIRELKKMGIQVYGNYADSTTVIGVIEGAKPGPTRALRAAMDGFSVSEETDLLFSSKKEGCMHATGHDGLVAISLGVVKIISQIKDDLQGKIIFIFQPAEEGGGGAKFLVDKGLIKDFNIDMFFGYHISPDLPAGVIGLKDGVLTSNSDRVYLEIIGKGAHAAKPDIAIDPAVITSHLILAYQEIISREISPFDFATLSFGEVKIGSTYNAIPEKAILRGSIRTYSSEVQDYIEKRMKEIFKGIISTFRASGKIDYHRFYPSVINDKRLVSKTLKLSENTLEKQNIFILDKPSRIAEDVAFYCREKPSCFTFIGNGGDYDVHSSHFVIDESIFLNSIKLYSNLLLKTDDLTFNN